MGDNNSLFGGKDLVEISAVATLVGATVAERLTLGLRGPGGLAWCSISVFGQIHVAKAAIAASVPDWARESFGLRNENVDTAIGLVVPYSKSRPLRSRGDWGDPVAIMNNYILPHASEFVTLTPSRLESGQSELNVANDNLKNRPFRAVYYADGNVQLALYTIPAAENGAQICEFQHDKDRLGTPWKDWMLIAASLLKITESLALRIVNSDDNLLWIIDLVASMTATACAAFLQIRRKGRNSWKSALVTDVVAGTLPNAIHFGGNGKVLLGLPVNVKRDRIWKGIWAIIGLTNLVSIVGSFLALSSSTSTASYVWLGFQAFWLVVRSGIYSYADSAKGSDQAIMTKLEWGEASVEEKRRVFKLVSALSELQIAAHPRGLQAYVRDVTSPSGITRLLSYSNYYLAPHFTHSGPRNFQLNILSVIGDATLRGIAWMRGTVPATANLQLYDSCLIVLKGWALGEKAIAVPGVGVYATTVARSGREIQYDSAGNTSHRDAPYHWVIWLPTRHEGNEGFTTIITRERFGLVNCEFLTKAEVDSRLEVREWNHTLRNAKDIADVLEVSTIVSHELRRMWTALK